MQAIISPAAAAVAATTPTPTAPPSSRTGTRSRSRSRTRTRFLRSTGAGLSTHWLTVVALVTFYQLAFTALLVCPNKIASGEECSSSTIVCYECDSRSDPNCVDPFDFTSNVFLEMLATPNLQSSYASNATSALMTQETWRQQQQQQQQPQQHPSSDAASTNNNMLTFQYPLPANSNGTRVNHTSVRLAPKVLPPVKVCRGCCVKITTDYFKRTCTSQLQINTFMINIVCMRESGDRGKMCFCDSDYCNSQEATVKRIGSHMSWFIQNGPILVLATSTFLLRATELALQRTTIIPSKK